MKNYFLVSEVKENWRSTTMRHTLTNNMLLNHVGWEVVTSRSIESKCHNWMDVFAIESENYQMCGCVDALREFVKEHPEETFEWFKPGYGRVGAELDEEEDEDEPID